MVGQRFLVPFILVRIQAPEPKKEPQAFMPGAFSLDSAGIRIRTKCVR